MQTTSAPPIFRKKVISSLNVPRRYKIPVILLRGLSLIPALLGFSYNSKSAWRVAERDAGGAVFLYNNQPDYWVATLWCALAGYWSWVLMTSMIRRWLYHYEVNHALVRLLTLIVLNWSISAYISSRGGSPTKIWMTICFALLIFNILKLVIANSPKYHRKAEDVQTPRINLKSTAVKVLVLPLFVVILVTMFVALHQVNVLSYTTTQLMSDLSYSLDATLPATGTHALVLIMSSWSKEAVQKRQMLRDTSLQLADPTITYRFVLGQPPSAAAQWTLASDLIQESNLHHDLLIVPASDCDDGWKLSQALQWSLSFDYQYLVKTNDDVFVRYDRLHQDWLPTAPEIYWKGFVYRNMAWNFRNPSDKVNADYGIPVLPVFTSGTLYTLSKGLVQRAMPFDTNYRHSSQDDENLAFWLFGHDVTPTHDARIQDWTTVCEEDQIAKRFNNWKDMKQMYNNIQNKQPQCTKLDQGLCAPCYPCFDKKNDWRQFNLKCDVAKGVSPMKHELLALGDGQVKDNLLPSVIGDNDEWIIDQILSKRTSVYSDGDDWSLVYWVCWTSEPSTFTERHWRALELVWVHEPRAVIFMITNTLPTNFFQDYTSYGYNIKVVHFNKENLLNWQWYFGPGTRDWLEQWDRWEKGQFFYWHLTDYIRCLLLYNYGGTYMDMDALWIRTPPDRQMEFIGSDYSSLDSDKAWTLDDTGLYLPQGVMRFKRGWKLFREMAELAFSAYTYDPSCFNCGGPKMITTYVHQHRVSLEAAGFTILPRKVLYPVSYLQIDQYLLPDPLADHELRTNLMQHSWNIHLFGKMTNKLQVQRGSIVDLVLRAFDLDLPHASAKTGAIVSSTSTREVPLRLIGPRAYTYQSVPDHVSLGNVSLVSQPGKLQGLSVVYVRGGPPVVDRVQVEVQVQLGHIDLGADYRHVQRASISLEHASQQQTNALLNSLVYYPNPLHLANGGKDSMRITVTVGSQKEALDIHVVTVEPEEP
ncbi:hypothetical protein DM01DRAFT_1309198 [Hesseltinella vesiculosa]|uniref:Alpha 1,4-glycosyltransferase domain-containing protein n=1 Tax=Hesseltinella vesiculosa TaxID=101127 RepID=A0A1X2GAJ3_9FUNG|nr:hypothetical protein DM01DRAFT_1309198 [Hesseltinella vesiculosa]